MGNFVRFVGLVLTAIPLLFCYEATSASSQSVSTGMESILPGKQEKRSVKIPWYFEPNAGQSQEEVKFVGRNEQNVILFFSQEAVLALPDHETVTMQFRGADSNARILGNEILPGVTNYFLGDDPSNWRSGVPHFSSIRYENIYPGIDLVFYGNGSHLEYDFVIQPGADPNQIAIQFGGAREINMTSEGSLSLHITGGELVQRAPHIFQPDRRESSVTGRFVRKGPNEFGFQVDFYDPDVPLVIDPVLDYGSYLSGSGYDSANGVALDSSGNVYIAGITDSPNFLSAKPNRASTCCETWDVFVTKLSGDGSKVLYTTYLGGNSTDYASSIAVDLTGAVYVAGRTDSTNFPEVRPAQGANRGLSDAFVTKISPDGSTLTYSTYLGGANYDVAYEIKLDSLNQAYVVGTTSSENFRTRFAAQRTYGGGGSDAFLTLFDSAGQIAASTYIGGRGRDSGAALATDNNGNIFVSGNIYEAGSEVESRAFLAIYSWASFKQIRKLREVRKFPEYFAVYDQFLDSSFLYMVGFIYDEETGDYEATIIKTDRTGKMVALKNFGERVGGFTAIAGAGGSLYLTGTTYSTEFPTKNAFQNEFRGGIEIGDGFVMKISAKTFAVIYSSYLGGGEDDFPDDIAVDLEGTVFVVGQTKSFAFPTTPNALSRSFGGGFEDGFLVRIKE